MKEKILKREVIRKVENENSEKKYSDTFEDVSKDPTKETKNG